MKKVNVLRVFLASPGDVKAEREMIFTLKDDLDVLIGKDKNIKFEIINWERNTYPGKGEDAQDVINEQIGDEYDIFIGIFWQRFGTPTNRHESGTVEEYENAKIKYENDSDNTHILMYFKTQEVDLYSIDLEQFSKVKEFKNRIAKEEGIYYSTFDKTEDLKNLIQLNLSNLIRDKFSKKRKINSSKNLKKQKLSYELPEKLDKYELLAKKIDEGNYNIEYENLLEDIGNTTGFLYDLVSSITKISDIMKFFTLKTTEKTKQFDRVNNIKDEKLKLSRTKKISNDYSLDLDKYSEDFENILPEFKEAINNSIQSYSEIVMKTVNLKGFDDELKNEVLLSLPEFLKSVEGAIDGTASLLESFTKTNIHLTSKLSSAKRRAELATNNIFKELLNLRKLLKQLLDDNNLI